MKYRKMMLAMAAAAVLLGGCAQKSGATEEYIGTEAAKALAFQDSGVTEADAVVEKTGLDTKNGIAYYEVDFTSGGYQYEYDIDAITGVIIESQSKADDGKGAADSQTAANQTGTQAELITEEKAKEIALSHAGLSSENVTFVRAKLDRDDGRWEYEVEFYSADGKEYDYEINASTGEILSYDYDAEYYQPASTGTQKITEEEAKNIALSQVSGATAKDIYEFEADYDDGRLEYEGKIYYDNMEYEFSIDGYSGAIREWEAEAIRG
ncbi:PepSY domain-containing protein [Anaerotignum lactatifermentans]|uniref:PepSY domain-containing protein n=1 Tax=Anaerotignum lactatifermentans TaxID=160404 RepID=A0ABS2GCC3_9FIRM|nr:PepSY domain-containing protein [Anaerotignum lactatifermentans]MBM6830372.1 PepSY domain-containing protein [Anaerotignum lactatifermentans]MBM6878278.1 PepSY domain-containing protein [Anaerotignum lactatifermentans]MBM6951358.1 PepSY domain-containing protein [Anaerotignum lactatifermentans]